MKPFLLRISSTAEVATGVVLVARPSIVIRLLFDSEIAGAGILISRIAGFALIALGIACWPGSSGVQRASFALAAMLSYSLFATLYLAHVGIGGQWVGPLLWPAVAIHAVLTVLLARMWVSSKREPTGENR